MPASILSTAQQLRSALAGFDVASYSGADCARLVKELSATEKACAAVRVLAAKRAVECKEHEQHGFADGADWLATQSGITPGEAKGNLNTAGRLSDRTKEALLAGDLSLDQAEEITNTKAEVPDSEGELVELARKSDLARLRDQARDVRLGNIKREELHERQVKARHFRSWRDPMGMVRFSGGLPPETGVPLVRRIELLAHKLRNAAKLNAKEDPTVEVEAWEAYAADALVDMLKSSGAPGSGSVQTVLNIVCDLRAWRRGHTDDDEQCHIVDGSPIPVDLAKELAKDAFLKAVLHDGVEISHVKHFGRHIPAEVRTALDLGDPPDFKGAVCEDCGKRHSLEYDHVDPFSNGGPTSYDNLKPRLLDRPPAQDRAGPQSRAAQTPTNARRHWQPPWSEWSRSASAAVGTLGCGYTEGTRATCRLSVWAGFARTSRLRTHT